MAVGNNWSLYVHGVRFAPIADALKPCSPLAAMCHYRTCHRFGDAVAEHC
jgi:hypothetical protein